MIVRVMSLVLLLAGGWDAAAAAVHPLSRVRFGQHKTHERVVLDLTKSVAYRILPSSAPEALVVEFPGLRELPAQTMWRTRRHAILRAVRFEVGANHLRATLVLRRPGRVVKHFHMTAPPRLVIDVSNLPKAASVRQAPKSPAPAQRARPPRKKPTAHIAQPKPMARPVDTPAPAAVPVRAEELPKTLTEKQLLAKAEEAWKAEQYEDGAVAYKTFLVRFPTHPQNHLIATRLADILREQGQLLEALHAYAKVVATYPETEGALMSQIRMAELSVTAPDLIHPSMARDSMRYRPYGLPVPTLQQLIREVPFHPLSDVARYTIGVILLQNQKLPAALTTFRELLGRSLDAALRRSVEDKFRLTLQQMMTAHIAHNAYGKALQMFFEHKAALGPGSFHKPELLLPVARSYAGFGLLPEASHIFQMVLASDAVPPKDRQQVVLEHATILAKSDKSTQAQALLTPLEQFPDGTVRHEARRLLGNIALENNRPAEAETYFQPIETLVPDVGEQARIFARLARVYEEQGAFEPAFRTSQQCVERAWRQDSSPLPVAEECLFHTGAMHIAQQQYRAALAVYQSLLQAFPHSEHRDWILFQTVEIYRQLRETPRMQETLRTLQANTRSAFWKRIVEEYANDDEWRERFQERLAQFTMRERGQVP